MIKLNFDTAGFLAMEKALMKLADKHIPYATSTALTRVAASARAEITSRFDTIFDRPTPFTKKSIRYSKATATELEAMVYISDDAPKGVSPRNFLRAEIEGGDRRYKRSEKALIMAGIMHPGQYLMPGEGVDLDSFGNIPGATIVQILSRLSAFGEQGYGANVSARTLRKLKKSKMAARRGKNASVAYGPPALDYGGTEYFVKKDKGGLPVGIFKLVSKGKITPVLYFANRNPEYHPRFEFNKMVLDHAGRNFDREMMRALNEEIERDSD